jgi:predicted lipid-binding transport protein (Tim44 family)
MDALAVLNLILIIAVVGAWLYLRDAADSRSDGKDDSRRHLAMIGVFGGNVFPTEPRPVVEPAASLGLVGRTDPRFLEGARAAYELIVDAVARDDLEAVEHLLTNDTRLDFATVVAARRIRGEVASVTLIGFRAAELIDSGIVDGTAWADVRFATDLVSVLRDGAGNVIEGNPHRIVHAAERWTFEQDLSHKPPQWRLAATDVDGG